MMRETAEAIDVEATNWVSRMDRGLTDDEEAALTTWLSADTRRRGAFTRAQAIWGDLDRAQVFRIADDARRAPERPRARPANRGVYATAALVLIIAGAATWFGHNLNRVSTIVGEIRQVPLADGSRVTLDTRSQIEIDFAASNRLVRLESGEALFEVAKDPKRPFVVQAGKIHVRAVGTVFLVRRVSDSDVEVTVTKGAVDVWSDADSSNTAARLSAGNRTSFDGNKIAPARKLTAQEIERAVDWKSGMLNLDGRTLGEAAAEINRYNGLRIEIPDAHLAAQTLVGNVSSSDPVAFADAAAAMFGAHVRLESNRLILDSAAAPRK
jgi:transmembrane sensor